eukprot:3123719-Rhodomonas_salina.1
MHYASTEHCLVEQQRYASRDRTWPRGLQTVELTTTTLRKVPGYTFCFWCTQISGCVCYVTESGATSGPDVSEMCSL